MSKQKCPKCGASMEEGYILDSGSPARWMPGEPDNTFLGSFKQGRGSELRIESCRCVACGYLELYALKPAD